MFHVREKPSIRFVSSVSVSAHSGFYGFYIDTVDIWRKENIIRNMNHRTQGFAHLTPEEQRQFIRLLNKSGTKYRTVHTKEGSEVVLLKITASGLLPEIVQFLHQFGVDLIDKFSE